MHSQRSSGKWATRPTANFTLSPPMRLQRVARMEEYATNGDGRQRRLLRLHGVRGRGWAAVVGGGGFGRLSVGGPLLYHPALSVPSSAAILCLGAWLSINNDSTDGNTT
ncbi:hypothetical protein B0H14DRAFT_3525085 [Mycena olivaceomarginata]|nr:hypothetical protein B0H14DRAFT_3525085 [Mycena olivaceomarginata]